MKTISPQFDTLRMRAILLHQILPALLMTATFLGVYALSVFVPPGPLTFAISAASLAAIWFVAVARVNDIGANKTARRWHIRRLGLVFAGCGCVAVVSHVTDGFASAPSWGDVLLHLGIAITLATTPAHPPFWKYISKNDPKDEP